MTLCDVVGRLFQGVCKKGDVHHGLFLLGPPDYIHLAVRCEYLLVTFPGPQLFRLHEGNSQGLVTKVT